MQLGINNVPSKEMTNGVWKSYLGWQLFDSAPVREGFAKDEFR